MEIKKRLIGGSFATLSKEINMKNSLVVRKEATEGKEKLIDEIQFILSLPENVKKYFPEILNYEINIDKVYFEMKYYPLKTLTHCLFDNEINSDQTLIILKNVFDFMFKEIYSRNIKLPISDMVNKVHFERVDKRFKDACDKASIFKDIIFGHDKIIINGDSIKSLGYV